MYVLCLVVVASCSNASVVTSYTLCVPCKYILYFVQMRLIDA